MWSRQTFWRKGCDEHPPGKRTHEICRYSRRQRAPLRSPDVRIHKTRPSPRMWRYLRMFRRVIARMGARSDERSATNPRSRLSHASSRTASLRRRGVVGGGQRRPPTRLSRRVRRAPSIRFSFQAATTTISVALSCLARSTARESQSSITQDRRTLIRATPSTPKRTNSGDGRAKSLVTATSAHDDDQDHPRQ
jgi:hypothetical protein